MDTCQDTGMKNTEKKANPSAWSWAAPPRTLTLPAQAVHVWLGSLDVSAETEKRLTGWMTGANLVRLHQMASPRKKREYIISQAMLRVILAKYLHTEPAALRFRRSEAGRPMLDEPFDKAVLFSMTHSGNRAAYAVTRSFNAGVDIECFNPRRRYESVAWRFFSEKENEVLRRHPRPQMERMFYQFWTAKEAVSKALGTGLAYPLSQYEIEVTEQGGLALAALRGDPDAAKHWALRSWNLPDGVLTCAVEGRPRLWAGYSLAEHDLG